eukprot:scaffold614_cov163-Amphora_coffeaeformis.AAC.9
MYRNTQQLDRRRNNSSSNNHLSVLSLRHQSSSLSSSSSEGSLLPTVVAQEEGPTPVLEPQDSLSHGSNHHDDKKTRGNPSAALLLTRTVWRSILSLNPFGVRESGGGGSNNNNNIISSSSSRRRLPRYDIQTSVTGEDNHHHASVREEEDGGGDVQVIAISSKRRGRHISEDMDSSSYDSSAYDAVDMLEDQTSSEEVLLYEKGSNKPRHAWILRRKPTLPEIDVEAYMANREMSALQEKCNALTMIPLPMFCMYYIWACWWIPNTMMEELNEEVVHAAGTTTTTTTWPAHWMGEPADCPSPNTWGLLSLPYFPPAPVLAVALGVTLHTPWSMLYHWKYAHQLPAGAPRMNHWSRRMDHAMMHLAAAMVAYGTSGCSWDYMVATGLFNADSAYRHFEHKVAPRRNKVRITLATLAYSMPLLRSGHAELFLEFCAVMGVCGWLFAAYPIGGWSHTAFHALLVITLFPLLQGASLTGAAQESVLMAAQCSVWNKSM